MHNTSCLSNSTMLQRPAGYTQTVFEPPMFNKDGAVCGQHWHAHVSITSEDNTFTLIVWRQLGVSTLAASLDDYCLLYFQLAVRLTHRLCIICGQHGFTSLPRIQVLPYCADGVEMEPRYWSQSSCLDRERLIPCETTYFYGLRQSR